MLRFIKKPTEPRHYGGVCTATVSVSLTSSNSTVLSAARSEEQDVPVEGGKSATRQPIQDRDEAPELLWPSCSRKSTILLLKERFADGTLYRLHGNPPFRSPAPSRRLGAVTRAALGLRA